MVKKQNEGQTGKEERFQWTAKMDDAFIEAMIKEQDDGNRIDGSFTAKAYTNMVNNLTEKLNKEFKKDHLKNRLKTLKEHFSQCYDVFRGVSLSGFAWNPATKLIEAEEEVWEQLIKEKPEAAKWKTKEICHYDELLQLFAKDRASGTSAVTAKERRQQMENQPRIDTIDVVDQMLEANMVTLENPINVDDTPGASTPLLSQSKLPTITKGKNKKRKLEEEKDFEGHLMNSIDKVAEAIRISSQRVYSENEIYSELELMDMTRDDIFNAYLFLVKRPDETRALFGCPIAMRMDMLQKMMNSGE